MSEQLIHIGWCNTAGRLVIPPVNPLTISDMKSALEAIASFQEIEAENHKADEQVEWFLLVGDKLCQRPCSECADDLRADLHHWLFDMVDDEDEEDGGPEARMVCKHCETWRTVTNNDED